MKCKLCSMRRPEDIRVCNALRPEYIGFIFVPGRSRSISVQQARRLRALLDPGITPVGVFIDADPRIPASYVQEGIIDVIQLHGQEDAAYVARLRALTSAPLIKAFRVKDAAAIEAANAFPTELILLDAGAGGSGETFDWNLLHMVRRPYLLAGGLTPENVADALAVSTPYGVDVSSGVETDGRKDPEKMRAFVTQVRQAGTCCPHRGGSDT